MDPGHAYITHVRSLIINTRDPRYRFWERLVNFLVAYVVFLVPSEVFLGISWFSKMNHWINLGINFDILVSLFILPKDRYTNIVSVWSALDIVSSGASIFTLRSQKVIGPYGLCFLLLRLWRGGKINNEFSRWEKQVHANYYFVGNYYCVRFIKFICIALIDIHYGGSVFCAIAFADPDGKSTWLGLTNGLNKSILLNSSLWHKYITSVYWSTTAFTTVGYGDVHPVSTEEMVFAVVFMLVNLVVLGYLVGSLTFMIVQEGTTKHYTQKIQDTLSLAKRCKMPADFKRELRLDLYGEFVIEAYRRQQQETLRSSPQFIRSKVADIFFGFIQAKQLYLFNEVSDGLVHQLASKMISEHFPPLKNVILQDQQPKHIYFLLSGEVDILRNSIEALQIHEDEGNTRMFGEVAALCNRRHLFTVRARTQCELLRLKQTTVMKILLRSDVKNSAIVMTNLMKHLNEMGTIDVFMKGVESEIKSMIARAKKQLPLSLRFAVERRDHVLLEKLLKDNDVDPNEADRNGVTALQYAAQSGHEMCVDCLLENRADPNSKDSDGDTPLWLALLNGHSTIAAKLNTGGATFSEEDAVLYTRRAAVFMNDVERHKMVCTMIKTYSLPHIAIRQ